MASGQNWDGKVTTPDSRRANSEKCGVLMHTPQ
jgi:hypothetical protein